MKTKLFLILTVFSVFSYFKIVAQGADCSTALPVTPGSFTATTLTGVASQPDATAAGWYSFTPSNSGIMNISSCGGGADTGCGYGQGIVPLLHQLQIMMILLDVFQQVRLLMHLASTM